LFCNLLLSQRLLPVATAVVAEDALTTIPAKDVDAAVVGVKADVTVQFLIVLLSASSTS